jgi:uncharacterized protein (DUF1697 family)
MKTCISILRGINVSGHKKILMSDLKALYEEIKFKEVLTYIQSGNVIFKSDDKLSDSEIGKKIEKKIYEKYKFDVPVIVRTVTEIGNAISNNPFLKEKGIDHEKLHITFLAERPAKIKSDALMNIDYSPDKFFIIDREVFLYCPNGYGNTKLSNNFFESKLKVGATTRNWKTVNKIFELANI